MYYLKEEDFDDMNKLNFSSFVGILIKKKTNVVVSILIKRLIKRLMHVIVSFHVDLKR